MIIKKLGREDRETVALVALKTLQFIHFLSRSVFTEKKKITTIKKKKE